MQPRSRHSSMQNPTTVPCFTQRKPGFTHRTLRGLPPATWDLGYYPTPCGVHTAVPSPSNLCLKVTCQRSMPWPSTSQTGHFHYLALHLLFSQSLVIPFVSSFIYLLCLYFIHHFLLLGCKLQGCSDLSLFGSQ